MPVKKAKPRTYKYEIASEKHLEFHQAYQEYNIRLMCGAYGAAKTYAAAADIIYHLIDKRGEYNGKTALVVGMTGHHCLNQLWPAFKSILQYEVKGKPAGLREGVDFTKVEKPQLKITFSNGSTILFASLEAKSNLAGYSVSLLFGDELDKTDEEWWNLMCSRVRGESERGLIIGTLNPQNKSHWLYRRYYENYEKQIPNPGVWCTVLTIDDNRFLSKQDREDAKLRFSYSSLEYRRAILGEWISTDGAVYTQFDRAKHTYDSSQVHIGRDWPKWAGIDFGFEHATVCLWVARNPENNAYYVYNEYYEEGRTPDVNAKYLLAHNWTLGTAPQYYVTDIYSETFEQYRRAGLPLKKANKGHGSVLAGVQMVQQLFFNDRIFIDRKCKNLIRELETYQFNPRTGEPYKKDDDACFAPGTQVLMADGTSVSIENVRVGDMVTTRFGNYPVVAHALTQRMVKTVNIEFENGTVLRVTSNHPIITSRGKVRADELRYGDISYHNDVWKKKQSYIEEKPILVIPKQNQGRPGRTLIGTMSYYTGAFGKTILEAFQRAIIFTTKTGMRLTTLLKILNVFQKSSILQNIIRKPVFAGSFPQIYNTYQGLESLPNFGTVRPKVGNGIQNTERPFGRNKHTKSLTANVAAWNTEQEISEAQTNSVQTTARVRSEDNLELITSKKSALNVDKHSQQISTPGQNVVPVRVVGVTEAEETDVYNLTVETVHELFANGVAVPQCDSLRYVLFDLEAKADFFAYAPDAANPLGRPESREPMAHTIWAPGISDLVEVPPGMRVFSRDENGEPLYYREPGLA